MGFSKPHLNSTGRHMLSMVRMKSTDTPAKVDAQGKLWEKPRHGDRIAASAQPFNHGVLSQYASKYQ